MENDLISRKALLKDVKPIIQTLVRIKEKTPINDESGRHRIRQALRLLEEAPSVDAEPVRHGRWEWITEDIYRCENCGERVHVKEVMGRPDWDYCPSCGAKMDGGAEG